VCAVLSWLFLVLMHFIPIAINDSATANESFLKQDSIKQLEKLYLFKERYTFVFFSLIFVGVFVMTATTSMILAFMRHICAMLKITW